MDEYKGDIHLWVSAATMGVIGPTTDVNDIENVIRMEMMETIRKPFMDGSKF